MVETGVKQSWDQVEEVLRIVAEAKPRRILDAGCGYGRLTLEIAKRFPDVEIIAMDQSPTMLTALMGAKPNERVSGVRAKLENLPLRDGAVDLVVCVGVLMHVEGELVAVSELVRVLRPQGILLFTYHNLLNPCAVWYEIVTLTIRPRKFKQAFHILGFYRRHLNHVGFAVDVHQVPILPSGLWPFWPGPLDRLVSRLPIMSARLGHEPLVECHRENSAVPAQPV